MPLVKFGSHVDIVQRQNTPEKESLITIKSTVSCERGDPPRILAELNLVVSPLQV